MCERKSYFDEDIVDDRNLNYTTISSLAKMASTKIIVELCSFGVQKGMEYDIVEPNKDIIDECNEQSLHVYMLKSLRQLPVPVTVLTKLEKHLYLVVAEVKCWAEYQNRRIFRECNREKIVFTYINKTVWNSNDGINYRETAVKMLSSSMVTELEKFRMACVYCITGELNVEKFSQLNCKDQLDDVYFFSEPIVFYWYHRLKGDLNKMYSYGDRFDDKSMLEKTDNEHALLYFWSRLDPNEQITEAISSIQRLYGVKYQIALLSQMSELQRYELFSHIGGLITVNFINSSYWEFAMSTWMHIKNSIADEEFVILLTNLLRCRVASRLSEFLDDMWDTVPDHLKHLCGDENGEILNMLTTGCTEAHLQLLLKILPTTRTEIRRNLFDKITNTEVGIWGTQTWFLSSRHPPRFVDELLNLCIPDADERCEIRRKLVNDDFIRQHCLRVCEQAKWNILDKFLRLYLPSISNIAEYKEQLLKSEDGIRMCQGLFCRAEYKLLMKIVDHVFPQANEAENFRAKLLLHSNSNFKEWIKNGLLRKLVNCIEQLLVSEENVRIVKERLIRVFPYHKLLLYLPRFHDSQQLYEFLRWLFPGDDKGLSKYKRNFAKRYKTVNRKHRRCREFRKIVLYLP